MPSPQLVPGSLSQASNFRKVGDHEFVPEGFRGILMPKYVNGVTVLTHTIAKPPM